jgi:hypothetical protein
MNPYSAIASSSRQAKIIDSGIHGAEIIDPIGFPKDQQGFVDALFKNHPGDLCRTNVLPGDLERLTSM